MIAALFVEVGGVYYNLPGVEPWDVIKDARLYQGAYKVIAHPPCERWGRYWGGGPMLHGTSRQKVLGDDNGCFKSALESVRRCGGLLEHPEGSHAFRHFNLPIPKRLGGWSEADIYGGRSCCVAQGKYGHKSQKLTWLYGIDINFRELQWGTCPPMVRMDDGYHSKEHRRAARDRASHEGRVRLSKKERAATPPEFRDLLISMVS